MSVPCRRFEGKAAIVTGGASGIGLATATRFAQEGARVVIADLRTEAAEHAALSVKQAGAPDAVGIACDVSKPEDVERAVDSTLKQFSRLDVIVNNAGLMVFKPLVEQTVDDWMKVLSVDLLGAFLFTRQAFLHMKPGSAIVNISSVHAVMTTPLVSSYAAAKAAILSLTRSSSLEAKPLGIRVNAVLPGAVDTPMLWTNPNLASGAEKVDKADVGRPEDLAAAIAFLASDEAAFVQGAALRVDGGRLDRL